MSMSVMVFDVGRGLCVAVRTPNNHLCLIDCGASDGFSPVSWLASLGMFWTGRQGYALTQFTVTHPHTDHLADIKLVNTVLKPSIVVRRTDINWARLMPGGTPSEPLSEYSRHYLPPKYTAAVTAIDHPDWGGGMLMNTYWLNEQTAASVSSSDNEYVNNTSVVTILRYLGYTFAVLGDIEATGMKALLVQEPSLVGNISPGLDLFGNRSGGVDFLVTSHHGHSSGFCPEWFAVTGPTKVLNVISERRAAPGEDLDKVSVDERYSRPDFSEALNREGRRMVSTKQDGTVSIAVHDDGQWSWNAVK